MYINTNLPAQIKKEFDSRDIGVSGLLALMIVEKTKCKKWFESLDEDKKQNYLEHVRALSQVKTRIKSDWHLWNSLGR